MTVFLYLSSFFISGTSISFSTLETKCESGHVPSCCSVTKFCPTLCKPHELQHTRLPCPSLSPRVCSNSCTLSQWCHPTISSSVAPFSSWPQSFPASRYFPVSWPFTSGGQSIGASASVSVHPMNIQGWFPLGLTGLISLLSKGLDWLKSFHHFSIFSGQKSMYGLQGPSRLSLCLPQQPTFFLIKVFFLCRLFLKSLLNFFLQYCFCFMFWFFGCEALAPQPGIKPVPPALEGKVITTGQSGKSQSISCCQCSSHTALISPTSLLPQGLCFLCWKDSIPNPT